MVPPTVPPTASPTTAATPAPYKLNGKVPTFSGKTLENIRIWLQQMDDLFKAARVPNERDTRTSLTTPNLTDSAHGFCWSLFYSDGQQHWHPSWQRFKEEMINKKHDKHPRHRRHDKRKDKLAKISAITIPPATKMPID